MALDATADVNHAAGGGGGRAVPAAGAALARHLAGAGNASPHHGRSDFVRRTIALAQKHGIAHEVLRAPEVTARFPQFMPETMDRQVSAGEQARMFEAHVAGRLRSVTPEGVHAAACLYTVSADSGFIVDAHPTQPNVTVVSACSGHGFKHSAGLGEALAQQILGQAGGVDLSSFSLDRFRG